MRFHADGPSIPDELLIARDEGRVIFFCGAGVSRARAGLSDFFGLAAQVVESLGLPQDHVVRNLIDKSVVWERETGIPGLISADRIFGLLEREFLTKDIETCVAKALKPNIEADLSAHRTILDLARSPEGKIRLVTTNFDLLFETCDDSLQKHRNPRLPDLSRHEEFSGIIHLHGHVDDNYKCSYGDGFVLSSSQFGDAYLADGWATRFIRGILERYVVVFVGYTADDPPVHYLLEALNKRSNSNQKMYAFQVGSQNDAEARWRHKGVIPIAFTEADNFKSLWDTLAAWAERAVNTDAWYDKIIDMAGLGPEKLQAHERGQVAHLVSFLEGARKFSSSENPPPAQWLCVFDPAIRFLKPSFLGNYLDRGPFFDPFEAYGLESDEAPAKIDPKDIYAKREVPPDAWSCFKLTALDMHNLDENNYAVLRGHYSVNVPNPPQRLLVIGRWLSRVSYQPSAVWWAAHQVGIHPEIQSRILFELERIKNDSSPVVRKAWRYIFTRQNTNRNDAYHKWFPLKASVDLDGWTDFAIRELCNIFRPYVAVQTHRAGPKPPENTDNIQMREMMHLDVEYPELHEQIIFPDEFLISAIREFRKNLELAVCLEKELDSYQYLSLCPIEPNPEQGRGEDERTYGINHIFMLFVGLVGRLIKLDPKSVKQEYQAWREDDDNVFARLKIWVAGQREILNGAEAGRLFCALNDNVFWNSYHQRDFLLALKKRWGDIPPNMRRRIERRLLRGRRRWKGEKKSDYIEHRAWSSLVRIHWLDINGCVFCFDIHAESNRLQLIAPEYRHQHAEKAAKSLESRGGFVGTDTEHSALIHCPLSEVLNKAKELSGREFEQLINKDPFAGLCADRPVRALSALHNAVLRGENPTSFWSTFLYSPQREIDRPAFVALIAGRLAGLPSITIVGFINPASDWFYKSSKILLSVYPDISELVWSKIIEAINTGPDVLKTSIVRSNKDVNWATEALNSPVGKLAQAIMNDPRKEGLKARKKFPRSWLAHVEQLLSLTGDHRRYALVMFAFNLQWFFNIDPIWTDKHLISVLSREDEDQEAFAEGFFWAAKVPNEKLYLRLKSWLLELPLNQKVVGRRESNVLSSILLAGWGSSHKIKGKCFVTNDEMRNILLNSDDDFRGQLIWHLERWASDEKIGSWKAMLPIFFDEAWPRQKQVKSSKVSAKLCNLTFSSESIFSVVIDAILPLLTKIDGEEFFLPNIRGAGNELIKKNPEKVLSLLSVVLTEDVTRWPYGIGEILPMIGEAEPRLLNDSRLIELKRRWNTR